MTVTPDEGHGKDLAVPIPPPLSRHSAWVSAGSTSRSRRRRSAPRTPRSVKRVEDLVEAEPPREGIGPLEAVDDAAERVEQPADDDQHEYGGRRVAANVGDQNTAAQPRATYTGM